MCAVVFRGYAVRFALYVLRLVNWLLTHFFESGKRQFSDIEERVDGGHVRLEFIVKARMILRVFRMMKF